MDEQKGQADTCSYAHGHAAKPEKAGKNENQKQTPSPARLCNNKTTWSAIPAHDPGASGAAVQGAKEGPWRTCGSPGRLYGHSWPRAATAPQPLGQPTPPSPGQRVAEPSWSLRRPRRPLGDILFTQRLFPPGGSLAFSSFGTFSAAFRCQLEKKRTAGTRWD